MDYVFFRGYGHWEFHQLDEKGNGPVARISPIHEEAAAFSLKDRKDKLTFKHTGKLDDVRELLPAEGHEDNVANYVFERIRPSKSGDEYHLYCFVIDRSQEYRLTIAKQNNWSNEANKINSHENESTDESQTCCTKAIHKPINQTFYSINKLPGQINTDNGIASDPVEQKLLSEDTSATRKQDTQALEQILIGHMMAIAGEANQIFRPVTMFDHGIDGEVEFKDNDGKASGKKIYVQLKSGNSYLRSRQSDDTEIFDIKNERHLEYWQNQPADVYLVICQQDQCTGETVIRWMNVTRYLKERKDKTSKQIVFNGNKLDAPEVWRTRDQLFPRH